MNNDEKEDAIIGALMQGLPPGYEVFHDICEGNQWMITSNEFEGHPETKEGFWVAKTLKEALMQALEIKENEENE